MNTSYKLVSIMVLVLFAITACGPLAPYTIADWIVKIEKATGNCKDCK